MTCSGRKSSTGELNELFISCASAAPALCHCARQFSMISERQEGTALCLCSNRACVCSCSLQRAYVVKNGRMGLLSAKCGVLRVNLRSGGNA